jgi:hypothetical protein
MTICRKASGRRYLLPVARGGGLVDQCAVPQFKISGRGVALLQMLIHLPAKGVFFLIFNHRSKCFREVSQDNPENATGSVDHVTEDR